MNEPSGPVALPPTGSFKDQLREAQERLQEIQALVSGTVVIGKVNGIVEPKESVVKVVLKTLALPLGLFFGANILVEVFGILRDRGVYVPQSLYYILLALLPISGWLLLVMGWPLLAKKQR